MNKDILPLLRCPDSGGDLNLDIEDQSDNRIITATLTSKETGRKFAVKNGIAEMLPSSNGHAAQPLSTINTIGWENRTLQVERGLLTRFFTPFECAAFRDAIELEPSDCLLEVGAGRGRMAIHFAAIPRHYICLDPSVKNLTVCQERILTKGYRYASWIQADPTRLPFHNDSINKLLSSQLISHIPATNDRQTALNEIARVCKPTSLIAISAYSYDLFAKIRGDKTGRHKGGLEYYRFTREEFIALLRTAILVDDVSQSLQYVWIGYGVPRKNEPQTTTM